MGMGPVEQQTIMTLIRFSAGVVCLVSVVKVGLIVRRKL